MFEFSIFSLITIAIVFACITSNIADDKGHDRLEWGVAGFFLGPFGLIAVAGLSDRVQRKYLRKIAENYGEIKEKE